MTWRLTGSTDIDELRTDRSDASGTGYFSAETDSYQPDLLELAMRGRRPAVPTVLSPYDVAGRTSTGAVLGSGRRGTTPLRRWVWAPDRAIASSRWAPPVW